MQTAVKNAKHGIPTHSSSEAHASHNRAFLISLFYILKLWKGNTAFSLLLLLQKKTLNFYRLWLHIKAVSTKENKSRLWLNCFKTKTCTMMCWCTQLGHLELIAGPQKGRNTYLSLSGKTTDI